MGSGFPEQLREGIWTSRFLKGAFRIFRLFDEHMWNINKPSEKAVALRISQTVSGSLWMERC